MFISGLQKIFSSELPQLGRGPHADLDVDGLPHHLLHHIPEYFLREDSKKEILFWDILRKMGIPLGEKFIGVKKVSSSGSLP